MSPKTEILMENPTDKDKAEVFAEGDTFALKAGGSWAALSVLLILAGNYDPDFAGWLIQAPAWILLFLGVGFISLTLRKKS